MEARRTVGRRIVPVVGSSEDALSWQTSAAAIFGERRICGRGVHRFESFEEADEWLLSQTAQRAREYRPEGTSGESQTA